MAAIVHKKYAYTRVSGSTFDVVLGWTPTPGNTLIVITFGNNNTNLAIALPTSPSGWISDDSANATGGEASAIVVGHRVVQAGDSSTLTFAGTTGFPQDVFVGVWEVLGTPAIVAGAALGTVSGSLLKTPSLTPANNGSGSMVAAMFGCQGSVTFGAVSPSPYEVVNSGIGSSPESAAMVDADSSSVPTSAISIDAGGNAGLYAYAMLAAERSVQGYLVARPVAAKDALKPLCMAYFFDMVETDGVLRAVPRGGSSVMTIPENDLGLKQDKKKLEATMVQEQDLPREVQVIFPDPALDYQQNKQSTMRSSPLVLSRNQEIVQVPIVFDVTSARQISEKLLYLSYLERKSFIANLWKAAYLQLDPADVFQFVYNGVTYQGRMLKTSGGARWTMEINAVSEESDNYSSTAVGGAAEGFQPAGVQPAVPATTFYLFDIPLLLDSDANPGGTGFYFCMTGPAGWPGGILYESPDDTSVDFAVESQSEEKTNIGTASTTLGAPSSPWALDATNTVTVTFNAEAAFGNETEATLLATGKNALLVGSEVIQFETAVQNVDGSWTFSNLLRGRRGTDWACGSHGASELVVDLSSGGMVHVPISTVAIGQTRYYRGVTAGGAVADVTSKTLDAAGVDLKPYSPVAIGGSADGAGNITMLWLRRTRFGGAYGTGSENLVDGVGGPLNEAVEKFEIDVYNGASVVRTITAYTNTAVYTAAQQVADFGSVQSTVTVKIYQISATVGRGYPGAGTVPGTTDATAESVTSYPGTADAGSSVDLTGQTASIAATNILTPSEDGLYEVSVLHLVSTAGTAGSLQTKIGWTDEQGAKTRVIATDLDLSYGTDQEGNSAIIRAKSTAAITYQTTVTGATGSPKYDLHINVRKL